MDTSEEMKQFGPVALATLLDRVRRSYPHGIAEGLLVAPRQEVLAHVVLIVVTPDGEQLQGAQAELLDGVRVKGLKLSDEQCLVKILSDTEAVRQSTEQLLSEAKATVCVVFGGDKVPGSVEAVSGAQVLNTYSLERIAREAALKRELWKQLQEHILPLLEGR